MAKSFSKPALQRAKEPIFARLPIQVVQPRARWSRRRHDTKIAELRKFLDRYSLFSPPIWVDRQFRIIAGHSLWKAKVEWGNNYIFVDVFVGANDAPLRRLRRILEQNAAAWARNNDQTREYLTRMFLLGFDLRA